MYTLPESLTISNIGPIRRELIRFLEVKQEKIGDKTKEAVLDFIHLKDLDTAGLQLLLSTTISFRKNDCILKVINVQEHLRDLFRISGAGDILFPA